MKQLLVLSCALLILSCSRPAPQGRLQVVDLVPSRERVFAASDSEPVVTSWLSLGMSFASAGPSVLYGLVISDSAMLDESRKPVGAALGRGSHVTVSEATEWERAGREFKRWYHVRTTGPGPVRDGWLDSSSVALITAARGSLSAGFLERKISISGGDSEYNLLVLCDGGAVSLIDTSALVFPDSFHPSGVTHVEIDDVTSDGVPEAVVQAQTIVSLQFLGASPLAWEAWLREKSGSWGAIFRFNKSYGTDQGNSYSATERAFSSTGSGPLDTVKVTTDLRETTQQGEFRTTITSFSVWNGSSYKEDKARELPQVASTLADATKLRAEPGPDSAAVETLKKGDTLYVFDRGDVPQTVNGATGFWLHATSHAGKDGWVSSSQVKLSKIDPLKINREAFLGHSAFSAVPPLSP